MDYGRRERSSVAEQTQKTLGGFEDFLIFQELLLIELTCLTFRSDSGKSKMQRGMSVFTRQYSAGSSVNRTHNVSMHQPDGDDMPA